MKIDDKLHSLTTIIKVDIATLTSQGTGFFYQVLGEKDPSKGLQWRQINKVFLITNRHVLLPKLDEKKPYRISLHSTLEL